MTVRSTAALTEPDAFVLLTDSRIRSVPEPAPASPVDPLVAYRQGGLTQPQPFNLTAVNTSHDGLKSDANVESFVPLVNKMTNFFKKDALDEEHASTGPLPLTEPKPFHLATSQRTKAESKILTRAQREEEEMKQMTTFKARKLNPKVMNSNGDLGVPRVVGKRCTDFREFKFSTGVKTRAQTRQQRAKRLRQRLEAKKIAKTMKAREAARKNITHGKKLVRTKALKPFALSTTNRKKYQPAENTKFKARKLPRTTFAPSVIVADPAASVPLTNFKPFQLTTESRGQMYEEELSEKLHKEEVESAQARHFVASKISGGKRKAVAAPKPLTQAKPFNLPGEALHAEATYKFKAKVQALEEEAVAARQFKAIQPPSFIRTYKPGRSRKPLTQSVHPNLRSSFRAEQREEYDLGKKQRRCVREEHTKIDSVIAQDKENTMVKSLRKQMVFKAAPIVQSEPFIIRKSHKHLTVAESPALQTRSRSRMPR